MIDSHPNENYSNIPDYTGLTCTNLMIKMKILTKKMTKGKDLQFFTTREGNANLEKIFSKNPFNYKSDQKEPNLFLIKITKN